MREVVQGRYIEPGPVDWRQFTWRNGGFDTARRDLTPAVEGRITVQHHLVFVTLAGSARSLEVRTDCGHSYSGPEMTGAVSFLPAGCNREFRMRDAKTHWASISLRPDLLSDAAEGGSIDVPAFTNRSDIFIASLLGALARIDNAAAAHTGEYCEAMTLALARHLSVTHGATVPAGGRRHALPRWQIRRMIDYIEANLETTISIADLARYAGLSSGHLHRALRLTTGQTPLELITARRIARARERLATSAVPIAELSLDIGFASPAHFAKLFRRAMGVSPSQYRDGKRKEQSFSIR
jgi:AraC family transcriptional regulator